MTTAKDRAAAKDADKATEASAKQVQEAVDKETDQGFSGVEVDPTPNENYTLKGVTSGKPTPETDPKAAEKAAGLVRGSRFTEKG